MPTYIVELEDGRELEVEADTPPTSEDLTQYFASQDPSQTQTAKKDLPFGDITDVASALGQAASSSLTTVPASFRQMYEGSMNPWEKSAESLESRKAMQRVAQESEAAQAEAEASGDASVMGRAIRSGIPSYGFTGAILPVSVAAGGVAGLGTGLVSKNPVAAQRAAMAAGSAASGVAAYRMAASQFMDDARERIDNFFLEKAGRLPNKQEQDEAYQELLPLAQEMGMAEALPEAFGNLALAGAGKYIYRILGGKTGVQQLASGALSKARGLNAAKALGAGAASTGVEVGTEGLTEMLNEDTMKKLEEGVMRGEDVSTVQTEPYSMKRLGESIEKVAEPTLATTAIMGLLGAGGGMAYRAATKQNLTESDFRNKMERQLQASQIGLADPEATAANKSIYGEKAEEAAAALKALDEGRTSDVEKFFNVRFKPSETIAEEPSMLDPVEVATSLNTASVQDLANANSPLAAKSQDDFKQAVAKALSPTEPAVQPVEEVETVEPEVTPYEPTTNTRPEILPENLPNLERDPFAEEETFAEKVTPLSEGAERNRAVIAEAAANLRGGGRISPGLKAAIPQQTPQKNAPLAIPDTESLRQEPQDRVESREAEETGARDQLLRPAEGEKEVGLPPRVREQAKDVYNSIASTRAGQALTQAAEGVVVGMPSPVDELYDNARLESSGWPSFIEESKKAADKLYSSYAGIRDALRKQFGPTIRLFRYQGSGEEARTFVGSKKTLNWASTEAEARQYKGENRTLMVEDIPIEDIVAVNVGPKGNYEEFVVFNQKANPDFPPSYKTEKKQKLTTNQDLYKPKKGKNFKFDGTYEVLTPSGIRRIFKDDETGAWMDADEKSPVFSPLPFKFLGYTKIEAIESLKKEQPQTTKAAETQTPESVGRGLGGSGGASSSLGGGRSPELPKVSTETETTSSEKLDASEAQVVTDEKVDLTPELDRAISSSLTEEEKAFAAKELGVSGWGEEAITRFKQTLADWSVNARKVSERLANLFQKVLDASRAVLLAIGVFVGSSVNTQRGMVSTQSVKEDIPVTQIAEDLAKVERQVAASIASTPEAEAALRMSPPKAKDLIGFVDSMPSVEPVAITIPTREKGGKIDLVAEKRVPAKRANFRGVVASEDATMTADWIVLTNDNKGKPFIVGDKTNGSLFIFDKDGNLIQKTSALFGLNVGDQLPVDPWTERVTPSGRFFAKTRPSEEYGSSLRFYEPSGSDGAVAIHRVYLDEPAEKRQLRLDSKSPADNRISYGCVNVDGKIYDKKIAPTFAKGGFVYIMPETPSGRSAFKPFSLQKQSTEDKKAAAKFGRIVSEAEQKQAKEEESAAKEREKAQKAAKASLNSIIDPEKTNIVQGTVSAADAESARRALNNSGEIPNAFLTRIYASPEAFLADRANQRYFPSSYARLQSEGNIEGLFERGQTLIFADKIGVSDLDRRIGKNLGISAEQAAARRVIAHENGHRSVALFTANEKREFLGYLRRKYNDAQIDNLVRVYSEYADWRTNLESRNEALEELFLKDFERLEKIPTGGLWDDIVEFLKRVWRRLTGRKGDPTLQDMKDVVRLLRNAMRRTAVPSYTTKDGGEVKLSASKPEYASDFSEASSAGAQLARDTVYDDRIIEMRDAIRRAYEQSNTEAGVAMPIDELYAKAKELAPDMNESEFGNILQDLYEDNGAVLQEGESAFDVFTPEGRRAGFAVIMPKRSVASRVETEGEAVKNFQEGIEAIESNSLNAFSKARPMEGADPEIYTVKPSKFYKQVANDFVNKLLDEGNSIESIGESLFSEDFLQEVGIKNNMPALVMLVAVVKDRVSKQSRDTSDGDTGNLRRVILQKLDRKLAGYWQNLGTNSGRAQGIRSYITKSPEFSWMFIFDRANENLEKEGKLAATRVASDLPQTADNLQKTDAKIAEETDEQVADDVEQFAESEDDTLLREGETALDSGRRSIWERMKDVLRKLALVARARKGRAANAAKASISKEERDAISQMSDAELAKMESDLLSEFDRLSEAFLKGGTEQQKATRKKMVATVKKRVEQGKPIEAEKESEEDEVSRAERTAQNILKDLSERYADPVVWKDGKKPNINEMRELYKQRVKQGVGPTQMSEEAFVKKAVELGADELTAGILWKAAELEIDAREAMRQEKVLDRQRAAGERADAEAQRIIFAKERLKRQSGITGIENNANRDTIVKAFKDQVENPVEQDEFTRRLLALKVSRDVAGRLFRAAAREKADLKAMEAFRRLEGPNALQTMLREIQNMRRGEEIPLRSPIPWRKLLSQKASTVEVYRQRIFDAISSEESLADLDDAQKAKLADLFTQAWESKRKAILDRMVDNAINQEEAAGRLTQEGADALRSQRQKLVEDINLGILDEDRLMKHLADKFGIKSEFTEAERANIDRLLDILQDDKLNEVKRNKAGYELLEALSASTKIPFVKWLADLWVTAVLSGLNTAASIAMAVANGGFELTVGVFRVLRAGFTNPKEVPAEIAASFKAMYEFLKAFGREGRLAWQYLVTGDRALLDPSLHNVRNDLNYDSIGKTVSLAERMAKSDKVLEKVMGIWMRSVSRLLSALDNFNTGVTKAGALPIVFRQLNLSGEDLQRATEKYNLKLYREKAIQEDFNNKQPTNQHEKALVDSYAKARMMADLQEFGKFSENADFIAQNGAMTLDPTGVGGAIYSGIKYFTGGATTKADKFLADAQREWNQVDGADKTAKGLQLAFAYIRQFIAYNSANLAGLRFARFAGNKFNQGLSFIPGIGMFRMYEATVKDSKIEAKDAFTDMIMRNQTAGLLFAIIGGMAIKAIMDEPDDEKRGFFWNGGWANLTPDQKQQKLAAGQKEYTIGIPGVVAFNYQNWPPSSVFAAIGSLSDLVRYSREQWNEKSIADRLVSAAASGVFSAGEIPALSGFQTLFGNNLSSKDPNEKRLDRFAKVMAGWGGGFVPRILKDIDFMTDPGLRKYESLWEQTASHIPVYRRYSGEEYYDILGKQIERKVWPGSREFMGLETDPEYRTLGKLNSRGIWLTPANAEHRMVGKGRNKRKLTQEEADAYSLETGKGYRQMLLRYGSRLEQMPTERARAFLMDKADEVRDRALKKIVR